MPDVLIVESATVLVEESESTVLRDSEDHVVVISDAQQGPPGPPGPGGLITHSLIASGALGGLRAVISTTSGASYASADNLDHAARVVGITLGAATVGNPVTVQATGTITELSWAWTPDEDIYLGLNGLLTQTIPPTAAFAQRLGYAVTPTSIWVDLGEPVVS